MATDEVPTQGELDEVVGEVQPPDDTTTVLGIPLNRILTIGRGPINVISGTVASWLLVHVHFLGLFHFQHDGLAAGIAQGVVWTITAVLTDRSIAQWVKGHHIELQGKAAEHVAVAQALAQPQGISHLHLPTLGSGVAGSTGQHPDGDTYDEARAAVFELEPRGAVAGKPGLADYRSGGNA